MWAVVKRCCILNGIIARYSVIFLVLVCVLKSTAAIRQYTRQELDALR